MDNMANSFCRSVYLNDYVKAFMNSNTEDLLTLGNTIRTLDTLTAPNLYIHSLYIYNRKLDTFISTETGSFYKSSEFYDQEIVNLIKNNKKSNTSELIPFPRKSYLPCAYHDKPTNLTNTYTYLMYDNAASSDETRGAIILNVDTNWLRDTMLSLNDNSTYKGCELFVINEDGLVVNHSKSNEFMKDISGESYIKRILSSKAQSGSFIETINGEKYIFSYVSSSGLKWRFISMTPYSSVFSSIDKLKIATISLCILVLLLGLFCSIIASRKLYFPINTLTNDVKKNFILSASENDMDELKFLSSTFNKVFDKANRLESLQNDNIESIKNSYLKNLLMGNIALYEDDISKKIKELGIKLNFEKDTFIFILKLDYYQKFMEDFDENDRLLFKYAISNIALEIVSKCYIGEIVDMGTDHFSVVININENDGMLDSIYDNLKKLVSEIQGCVNKYLHLSLSATLGYVFHGADTVALAYNNTLNISMYRLKYGHASIITPEALKDIRGDDFKFPSSKEKIILDSLKLGNMERAKEAYYDVIEAISDYPYDNIMASIIYLIFSIYNNTISNLMENSNESFSSIFTKFFSEVANYETLDEINQTFINIFEEIVTAIESTQNNKANIMAKNIIDIVNDSYDDKNLCLNSISDKLMMSSVYVGRLFKEATGKSVSEYISNVRMEKVFR
jgi:hypothetical protein